MRLAVHWADLHIADPEFAEACFTSPKTFAGEGSPSIDEFCVPEFATMLGRTNDSAGRFLTECVEVAYRLPGSGVRSCRVWWRGGGRGSSRRPPSPSPWRPRRTSTSRSSGAPRGSPRRSCVGWLMRPGCGSCPTQVQQALEDSADKRHVTFDTEQASFDGTMHLEADLEIPDALALAEAVASGAEHLAEARVHRHRRRPPRHRARRPGPAPDDHRLRRSLMLRGLRCERSEPVKPVTQIHLYAHLSADAITHVDNPDAPDEALCGRVEQAGNRLLSVDQIRAWCGRDDVQVVVNQVIDLRERLECQGYRPTPRMREHVIVRDGTCVFPWCGRNARHCDLDHVIPYNHDDPEQGGPTATDNLAPLCRRHHRLKTRGRWRYEMTEPGCSSGPARSATPTSATTPAANRSAALGPSPAPTTFPTGRTHTRPTSDHHAPDPARVTPAGPQARQPPGAPALGGRRAAIQRRTTWRRCAGGATG